MSNSLSDGMGWRVTISILTFFASIIGVIIWLFFYAEDYTIYQNVAIVVVIFLGFIAVMAATWALGVSSRVEKENGEIAVRKTILNKIGLLFLSAFRMPEEARWPRGMRNKFDLLLIPK